MCEEDAPISCLAPPLALALYDNDADADADAVKR